VSDGFATKSHKVASDKSSRARSYDSQICVRQRRVTTVAAL
jgi:hypothetical protein